MQDIAYPQSVAVGSWKSTAMLIVKIIAFILVIVIIWRVYNAMKVGSQAIGESLSNAAVGAQFNIAPERVAFLKATAQDLWDNAVDRPWYALWLIRDYDEPKFIAAINNCEAKEVVLLDQLYKAVSGERFKDVMAKDIGSDIKTKIRTDLYTLLIQ